MNYRELLEKNKDTPIIRLALAEFVSSYVEKENPDFQILCELSYETYLKIESLCLEEAVRLIDMAYQDKMGFEFMSDSKRLYERYSEKLLSE